VALAISGGSDSMALAALAVEYLGTDRITGLIVDHQLKEFGVTEHPEQVQENVGKLGIQSHIVKVSWSNQISYMSPMMIPGKLMMHSREKRYRALFDECKRNNIPLLITGHNLEDDIVTMLYRVSRMSGLDGLAGMKSASTFPFPAPGSDSFFILRPFLKTPKYQLINTCLERGVKWTHDKSNDNLNFRRNECLQALLELQAENPAITTESLVNLLDSFKGHRSYIHQKGIEIL
jgi:tRNA(Ile)-lysidine synthetase-like protein